MTWRVAVTGAMTWRVAVTVAVSLVQAMGASPASRDITTIRDPKLVVVMNFNKCEASGRSGFCFPYFQCSKNSGVVKGSCSFGFGNCCVFEKTCSTSSSARLLYFTSSHTQATDQGTCSLSITKVTGVCQLRLDMNQAELSEPTAEGACVKQYLQVMGASGFSPKICGLNSGQHLYFDVRGDAGPFKVMVVNTEDNPSSSWDIQVEQIFCQSPNLAPAGCAQYYTGLSGDVRSFNYHIDASTQIQVADKPGTRHLQETYKMCVRQEPGYCSVKWTAAEENYAFTLTGNPIDDIIPFNSATDELCGNTDYVFIPGGRIPQETEVSNIFCGSKFPDSVTSSSFEMTMVADGTELIAEDIDNHGFHLKYEQVKC
ncbi:uncharacterized protein [Procambarus clarkii]|uniref:uncharacterized protein n=2 Tax=Procambarus clarkii TaxID=6728 RepID=UPI003742CAE1